MAVYAYFANLFMLLFLAVAVFYLIHLLLMRHNITRFQIQMLQHDKNNQSLASSQYLISHYQKLLSCEKVVNLQMSSERLFHPWLNRVGSLKGIAPACGLIFTVVSIILSFAEFSGSGDVKKMFGIAAVGFSTTAIGTLVVVICRLNIDQVIQPMVWDVEGRLRQHRHYLSNTSLQAKQLSPSLEGLAHD